MTIIGIDLGTTNSACGVWRDGAVHLIPNRHGDKLTPSVVGFDAGGELIVGKTAQNRLITHPRDTVATFKRLMGTKHRIEVSKTSFTATELSAAVLRSLKEDAEAFLGEPVSEAIISVPAYFNDNQRHATKQAGEIAGMKVQRLINEPTAAALAYGLHDKPEGVFVVLDMGGGTFDVSVIEYFDGVMEVHASAGDNYLGGEDFLEAMVERFLADRKIERAGLDKGALQVLFDAMERAKRAIGRSPAPRVAIELAGTAHDVEITEPWFRDAVAGLLLRVRAPIEQALRDARIPLADIADVLLVGGATRMAVFRNAAGKLFGRIPSSYLDPDLVVAMGATVQAGLKARDSSLDDVVLTDVCPYTLGTEVVDPAGSGKPGFFLPLIERNSVVPTSRVERLFTVADKQARMQVNVFQGENRMVERNVFLGEIDVTVPKRKAGEESIDVRFSYDMNGLLEVDVKVNSSGETINKVIQQAPGALSDDEMARSRQRLAALKFHPREREENLQLLSQGERLYLTHLGDTRAAIGDALAAFEAVLDRQRDSEIGRARDELKAFLDRFDGDLLP
ncbi:MAG: molecular chaperone HscC [Alphaproteobacteria bacterium]|nr:MAG: molecular chaperone HscC [Alphaproteobacteria bacterium]